MSDSSFTRKDWEDKRMTGAAAVGPVTIATRTVFPQISAHQALCGLQEYGSGPIEPAPATLAVCLRADHPLPAFVFPQDRFAVKYADSQSWVKSGWGHNGVPYAGSSKVSCSGRTEKG